MIGPGYITKSKYMSHLENQKYEETKAEFFLKGKDPLAILEVEGNESDIKNTDSNADRED